MSDQGDSNPMKRPKRDSSLAANSDSTRRSHPTAPLSSSSSASSTTAMVSRYPPVKGKPPPERAHLSSSSSNHRRHGGGFLPRRHGHQRQRHYPQPQRASPVQCRRNHVSISDCAEAALASHKDQEHVPNINTLLVNVLRHEAKRLSAINQQRPLALQLEELLQAAEVAKTATDVPTTDDATTVTARCESAQMLERAKAMLGRWEDPSSAPSAPSATATEGNSVGGKAEEAGSESTSDFRTQLARELDVLIALKPFIRQYVSTATMGVSGAEGVDAAYNVLQLTRRDLGDIGVSVDDLHDSSKSSPFVDAVAALYMHGVLSFPFKLLYSGSAQSRMENLRSFKPKVSHERNFPHNVYFKSQWPEGRRPFLNRTYKGQCTTFLHDDADYNDMDVLVDFFQEKARLQAKRSDQARSPWSFFHEHSFLKGTIRDTIAATKSLTLHGLREAVYRNVRECTQFKPSLVVAVVDCLRCRNGRMLDFSAGWGDRLAGAIAADMRCYHAFDPNVDLKNGHEAIKRAFLSDRRQADFAITYTAFEEAVLRPDYYDLVLTSPPFYDFEVYTDLPGQSVDTYKTFEDWIVRFLLGSIRKAFAALKVGGKCVIHLTDVYKTRVCEPMCLLMLAYIPGAHYDGVLCSLGAAKRPRPLWVFEKAPRTDARRQQIARDNLASLFPSIHAHYRKIEEHHPPK